jgi:HD-like signal output (HDOD) protein
VGFLDRDVAYTCGVMHDIGRLALAVLRPKEYSLPLGAHSGTPTSILKAERELFGWDHCEVGRQLVKDWNLPPEFEAIVADHHLSRDANSSWGMPFSELLEELPVRERGLFHQTVEPLAFEISKKVTAVESA